jgi:hypothetical protein
VEGGHQPPPTTYAGYTSSPLSSWIESTFGIRRDAAGRLEREQPRSIDGLEGAAATLSALTGAAQDECADTIRRWLLGAYTAERRTCPDADQRCAFWSSMIPWPVDVC